MRLIALPINDLVSQILTSDELRLAARTLARECCRIIREAHQLPDDKRKKKVIEETMTKMHQATLMHAEARQLKKRERNS